MNLYTSELHSLQVTMDIKLHKGKSLDWFAIGDTLGHVTETIQSFLPDTIPNNLMYEQNAPILHDIYIEAKGAVGQQYFIEIDPYLQIVRAVNYTVQMNQNSIWEISGSHNINKEQPLSVEDILHVFGESVKVFTAAHGEILKLLYDGVCFVFSVEETQPKMDSLMAIKELNTQLTKIRLIPTEHSPHFKYLINRELSIKPNVDLSLYNLVQVGLILEKQFNRVMGISLTFPVAKNNGETTSEDEENMSLIKRVYFGQSCQCVLQILGSPDSVYYQERPTTKLFLSGEHNQRHACQQFVYNYLCLGVDIVFDAGTKQVKKFIFHTNIPNHVEFNVYSRCFFKFGVTESGYAKKEKCFLIHPGVDWKEVAQFFTGSQGLKFLSKLQRGESTNALCPFPLSSLWLLFNQLMFEITPSDNIATVYVCSVPGDEHLAVQGRDQGVLVETSFLEETTENSIEDQISLLLNDGQTHTSDVTPSIPEDDQLLYQPQPCPNSVEPSSMEPLEESDTFYSFTGQNNSTQDDQRGKTPEKKPRWPSLPYPYPFQAYHPTKHNEVYYSSSDAVMTWSQQATNCEKGMQFIHIEMVTEEENTLCAEAMSDHILLQSHHWRVSVCTREEQEAMDAATIAAREEELYLAQQQQDKEDFVCDTTLAVSNLPALDVEYSSITSEFEEISYPASDVSPMSGESTSDNDHSEPEENLLETGPQESIVIKDEVVSAERPPMLGDSVNNGNSRKGTESQLMYKPQSSRTAASRTRGIIKTTIVPPKVQLENPSTKKKPNSGLAKNPDGKSSSPQNQRHNKTSPKATAKFSKSSTATKVDRRKVHFYTDEKSKSIASSFKPKEKIEIVKRAHKDGTGYPHHHFKSSQLSALLQHGDIISDDSIQSQRPSTNVPNTFNRIFAVEPGQKVMKPQPIVRKLDTPFATEHNSAVFTDRSDSPSQGDEASHSPVDDQVNSIIDKPDQSDQTVSQTRSLNGQNSDQEDQVDKDDGKASDQTDKDNETSDQNGYQDSQTGHQDSQSSDQDSQTGDRTSEDGYHGTHIGNQESIETLDQHHLTFSQKDLTSQKFHSSDHLNQPSYIQNQNNQAASYIDNNEIHKSSNKITGNSNVITMTETPTPDQTKTIPLSTDLTSPINIISYNHPSSMDTNSSTSEDDKVHIDSSTPLTGDVTLEPSDNGPNLLESPQTNDTKPDGLQSGNNPQGKLLTTENTLPDEDKMTHTPFASEDVPLEDSNEENGHHSSGDYNQQLVSPRKQWSLSQPFSCPDSLNQVCCYVLVVFVQPLYKDTCAVKH